MHHWLPITQHHGSYVLASEAEEVERAVVFVHGFLGDAIDTWIDFQGSVEDDEWWHPADLYFFQYDSFGSSIAASADRFLGFLDQLCAAPAEWFAVQPENLPPGVRESLGGFQLRRGVTSYGDLVLVGHSLGGVVLRQAILRRARQYQLLGGSSPLLEASLRLFAPAISGARVAGLLGIAMRLGGIGGLAQASLGYSHSYAELQPEKRVVESIERETVELAQRFPRFDAFRADVVWGERDDIVIDREYSCDRFRGRMSGKDHLTVCKPGAGYEQPLELVSTGEIDGRP